MLKRKAYGKLKEWKAQENKKALCIIGARQIGKTTLIRQFGLDNYENFVEVNFVTDPDAAKIFDGALDADEKAVLPRLARVVAYGVYFMGQVGACGNGYVFRIF